MRAVIKSEGPAAAAGAGERFLRFPELRSRKGIPFSRMHVDRLEKRGDFPKRFSLGANTVGWLESEVDAWLAGKVAARAQPQAA
jgi:prophage regulatory protein